MKKVCIYLFLLVIVLAKAQAQTKSEALQVGAVLESLQSGNESVYLTLFPPYDTLLKHLHTTTDTIALINFGTNPQKLQQYDPMFNEDIDKDFKYVRQKGKDSGVHWTDILMARYELERMMVTRDLRGIEKIIEGRMQGYIMIEDILTRRHYIITVKDIMRIKGLWYGGHVLNVLEAESIDEYYDKLAAERKMEKQKLLALLYPPDEDTLVTPIADTAKDKVVADEKSFLYINTEEDEGAKRQKPPAGNKEITERKLYTGTFDGTTKVEMYIRGIKGSCPETACYWDAIYRFQDQDEYIKLEVTRKQDGTWIFDEEPDVGSMELVLKDDRFTGTWISNKDKTEYEVNFREKKEVKPSKLEELDNTIENGMFAN